MLPVKKSELPLIEISKNERYLSVYNDEPLTKGTAKDQFARIKKAFGDKIKNGFFEELSEALRRNGFTNRKLIDAVNNHIDNDQFPSVANIINHDKRIKLFTHHEFLEETKHDSVEYRKMYVPIDVDGKMFFVHKMQIRDYGVEVKYWESKDPRIDLIMALPEKRSGKTLNILELFNSEAEKFNNSELGKKLLKANKRAQMSFGINVVEYTEAMKEVDLLRNQIGGFNV